MRSSILLGCCLLFAGLTMGCGRAPQMAPANRKILEGLQSAISSKNMEWLEIVTKRVVEKHNNKEMSDTEFKALETIIEKATLGDWKQAQLDTVALCDGQRPTAQDLAMLKARKTARDATN